MPTYDLATTFSAPDLLRAFSKGPALIPLPQYFHCFVEFQPRTNWTNHVFGEYPLCSFEGCHCEYPRRLSAECFRLPSIGANRSQSAGQGHAARYGPIMGQVGGQGPEERSNRLGLRSPAAASAPLCAVEAQ